MSKIVEATAAQNADIAPISAEEILRAKSAANKQQASNQGFQIMDAIPEDMPKPNFFRKTLGNPEMVTNYENADGSSSFIFCRYPNKDFLPFVAVQKKGGSTGWANKFPSGKRPLLNLPAILKSDKILVCEGEKTAKWLEKVAKGMVVTTSVGGSNAAHLTDWSPLAGKKIVIVRDNDEQGRKYQAEVIRLCKEAGAKSIHILEPGTYGDDLPKGWDWGDAVEEDGLDTQTFYELMNQGAEEAPEPKKARSRYVTGASYIQRENGVFRLTMNKDGETDEQWICSPLEIIAKTRSADNDEWGYLIGLENDDGKRHEVILSAKDFYNNPKLVVGLLADKGLVASVKRNAHEDILEYLMTYVTDERVTIVSQIGWHNGTYVLPDQSFGDGSSERFILKNQSQTTNGFNVSGTLKEWQDNVAKPAQGNSRIALCLGITFASPVLNLVGEESGGFHLVGSSSIGKSTGGRIACSVVSSPDFIKPWRMTDNGAEGTCSNLNDSTGIFDEMGMATAKTVWDVIYMFSNEQGKTRADRLGNARKAFKWRILYLSNGEISIADKIREDGKNRILMAGQEVRAIVVEADAGMGHGIYDTIHDFADGAAFSNYFKQQCRKYYGTASRAFLEYLASNKDEATDFIKAKQKKFIDGFCPQDVDGQVKRVAARFGLVAAAGELAIEIGILPWNAGDMFVGVHKCFLNWLENRGSVKESSEEIRGIKQVLDLFDTYGASRFDDIESYTYNGQEKGAVRDKAHERWGWREYIDGDWTYFVTGAGLKELTRGFSQKIVLDALKAKGILETPKGNGLQKSKHIPTEGKSKKCYWLRPSVANNQDD